MPLIKIQTSSEIPSEVMAKFSRAAAQIIGKPENYVMVSVSTAGMMMAGAEGQAAFVEVKSIGGLNRTVCQELTNKICELLADHPGIPPERVYINFTEVPPDEWGWNNSLFG